MIPPEILSKLAQVRDRYGDGSEFVFDVSRDYAKLLDEKAFLNHPIFKDLVEDIKKQIAGLNALLLNDEDLTDRQRDKIFAERRALKIIFNALGVEVKDDSIRALEELIDSKLN